MSTMPDLVHRLKRQNHLDKTFFFLSMKTSSILGQSRPCFLMFCCYVSVKGAPGLFGTPGVPGDAGLAVSLFIYYYYYYYYYYFVKTFLFKLKIFLIAFDVEERIFPDKWLLKY